MAERTRDVATLENAENGFDIQPCVNIADVPLLIFNPNIAHALIPTVFGVSEGKTLSGVQHSGLKISDALASKDGVVTTTANLDVSVREIDPSWFTLIIPPSKACASTTMKVTLKVPIFIPIDTAVRGTKLFGATTIQGSVNNIEADFVSLLYSMYNRLYKQYRTELPEDIGVYIPLMLMTSYLASLASVNDSLKNLLGKKVTNSMLAQAQTLGDILSLSFTKTDELSAPCGPSVSVIAPFGGGKRIFTNKELSTNVVKGITLKGSSRPPELGIIRAQRVENPAGDILLPGLYPGYAPEMGDDIGLDLEVSYRDGMIPDTIEISDITRRLTVSGEPSPLGVVFQRPIDVFKGELDKRYLLPVERYSDLIFTYDGTVAESGPCVCNNGKIGYVRCRGCNGTGNMICPTCGGKGIIHERMTTQEICPTCNGAKVIACTRCNSTGYAPLVECPICHGSQEVVYRQPASLFGVRKLKMTSITYDPSKAVYVIKLESPAESYENISVFLKSRNKLYFIPRSVTMHDGSSQTNVGYFNRNDNRWLEIFQGAVYDYEGGVGTPAFLIYAYPKEDPGTLNSGFTLTTNPAELRSVSSFGVASVHDALNGIPFEFPSELEGLSLQAAIGSQGNLEEFLKKEGFFAVERHYESYRQTLADLQDSMLPVLPEHIATLQNMVTTDNKSVTGVCWELEEIGTLGEWISQHSDMLYIFDTETSTTWAGTGYHRTYMTTSLSAIRGSNTSDREATTLQSYTIFEALSDATKESLKKQEGNVQDVSEYIDIFENPPYINNNTDSPLSASTYFGYACNASAKTLGSGGWYSLTLSAKDAFESVQRRLPLLDHFVSVSIADGTYTFSIGDTDFDYITSSSGEVYDTGSQLLLNSEGKAFMLSTDAMKANVLASNDTTIRVLREDLKRIYVNCKIVASVLSLSSPQEKENTFPIIARSKATGEYHIIYVPTDKMRRGLQGYNIVKNMLLTASECSILAFCAAHLIYLIDSRNHPYVPFIYPKAPADAVTFIPFKIAAFKDEGGPIYPLVTQSQSLMGHSASLVAAHPCNLFPEKTLYYELDFDIDSVSLRDTSVVPIAGIGSVKYENGTAESKVIDETQLSAVSTVTINDVSSSYTIGKLAEKVNEMKKQTLESSAEDTLTVDTLVIKNSSISYIGANGTVTPGQSIDTIRSAYHEIAPGDAGIRPKQKLSVTLDISQAIPFVVHKTVTVNVSINGAIDFKPGKPGTISTVTPESIASLISDPNIVTDPSSAATEIDAIAKRLLTQLTLLYDLLKAGTGTPIRIGFFGFADPVVGATQQESALVAFSIAKLSESEQAELANIIESQGSIWNESVVQYNLRLSQRRAAVIACAVTKRLSEITSKNGRIRILLSGSPGSGWKLFQPFSCYGFGGAFAPALGLSRDELAKYRITSASVSNFILNVGDTYGVANISFDGANGVVIPFDELSGSGYITGEIRTTTVIPNGTVPYRSYGKTAPCNSSWYKIHSSLISGVVSGADGLFDTLSATWKPKSSLADVASFCGKYLDKFLVTHSSENILGTVTLAVK